MNRNDLLHWFILGFGQSGPCDDLGRTTNISQLWQGAKRMCFDCDTNEVLDALYTLPREHATLIKFVPADDGIHPVCFDRVRNTIGWPEYFSDEFSVKVLAEGKAYYRENYGSTCAAARGGFVARASDAPAGYGRACSSRGSLAAGRADGHVEPYSACNGIVKGQTSDQLTP